MTTAARKLHELDDKVRAVREAKAELERLEMFLLEQRRALTGELQGAYGSVMAGVGVSDGEVQARIQHAVELAARWGRKP